MSPSGGGPPIGGPTAPTGGTPPPGPGSTGTVTRPPDPTAYLELPVMELVASDGHTLPMNCYSLPKQSRHRPWPGGKAALQTAQPSITPNITPITDQNEQRRIITALVSLKTVGNWDSNHQVNRTTIRNLLTMSTDQRADFIDQVWDWAAAPKTHNTPAQNMYVPPAVPTGNGTPLPSSWCPIPLSSSNFHRRHGGRNGRDAWAELAVGFRIDGSDQAAIKRVLTDGMTPQVLNRQFMLNFRGQFIEGTAAESADTPRFWTRNHDIWNESAVCVSRNFFGATAFQTRETSHKTGEYAVLWAVDCKGLLGFDTEGEQLGQTGGRVWRPGEKCFPTISPDRMIGYALIRRTGVPRSGDWGWGFEIGREVRWEMTGGGSVPQKMYAFSELDAWRGNHRIPASWDFAN